MQREDEILRSYIAHFNKEAFSIDEADDKILVAASQMGYGRISSYFLYIRTT